jgi:hypothetical protein
VNKLGMVQSRAEVGTEIRYCNRLCFHLQVLLACALVLVQYPFMKNKKERERERERERIVESNPSKVIDRIQFTQGKSLISLMHSADLTFAHPKQNNRLQLKLVNLYFCNVRS